MYWSQSAFSGTKLNSYKFVWGRGDVPTCEICFFVALISISWYAAGKSLKRTKGIWWSTVLGTMWIICKHVLLQILVGWCTMHTLEARSMARLRKGQKIASSSGVGWWWWGVNHQDWLDTYPTLRHSDTLSCTLDPLTQQWFSFMQRTVNGYSFRKTLPSQTALDPVKNIRVSSVSRIQRGTNRLISLRNMCS